jgi:hypothetical protein
MKWNWKAPARPVKKGGVATQRPSDSIRFDWSNCVTPWLSAAGALPVNHLPSGVAGRWPAGRAGEEREIIEGVLPVIVQHAPGIGARLTWR